MGFNPLHGKHRVRRASERRLQSASLFLKFSPRFLRLHLLPAWVYISLVANGCLAAAIALTLLRSLHPPSALSAASVASPRPSVSPAPSASPSMAELGMRHQLTYQQWVEQLAEEAKVAADQQPEHLSVLVGDSISLWFPEDLLPAGRSWLNQGISGETSAGLLKRLHLFAKTEPETIFVLIGINDLIRGVEDQALLENGQELISSLQAQHPRSQIVVQSILPHAGTQVNWEGRDRLLAVSNRRIQQLNQELEAIAQQAGVYFLDLYPLFATAAGDLRPELSTDGLHLSARGYQVWSIALQVYSREVLEPDFAYSNQ